MAGARNGNRGKACNAIRRPRLSPGQAGLRPGAPRRLLELDLDVDAGRQVELHQRVHGLVRGVDDVHQAQVRANLQLIAPIAMEQGLRFAIREGGRTVGAGVVAKVLE